MAKSKNSIGMKWAKYAHKNWYLTRGDKPYMGLKQFIREDTWFLDARNQTTRGKLHDLLER